MRKDKSKDYQAFLLRLWRDHSEHSWRATLEDPHTGRQDAFKSLEGLFGFLRRISEATEAGASQDQDKGGER